MPKLSKREITFFCRSLETNRDNFGEFFDMEEKGKERLVEESCYHSLDGFNFCIDFNHCFFDYVDDDGDKIYFIDVCLRFDKGGYIQTIGRITPSAIDYSIEKIIEKLKLLEDKSYSQCRECENRVVFKNDLCKVCYPKAIFEKDYSCVICRTYDDDDDGKERVWVKLDCSHIYHWKCFMELRKNNHKKCPLCRADNLKTWKYL